MTQPTTRTTSPIWVALILALVPLSILPGIYEYALLPKRLVLAVLTTTGLCHMLLRIQSGCPLSLPRNTTSGLFVVFVGLSLASALHAPSADHALGEAAFLIALLSASVLSLSSLVDSRDWSIALWGLTASALLASTIGVLDYWVLSPLSFPSNGPPSATFGFRNFAAMFLVCAIPLVASHAIRARSTLSILVTTLAAGLSTLFLVYTRTRGAWLGFGIGALTCTVLILWSASARNAFLTAMAEPSRRIIVGGVVALVLVLAPFSERFVDTGLQRFDEKKSDVVSTFASMGSGDRGRLDMWGHTSQLIWDHLITGVGLGSWQHIYPAYDGGTMLRSDSSPKRPHNDYLWVAAESGILAGVIYAAIPVWLLVQFYRRKDDEEGSLLTPFLAAAVVGLAVHGIFSFPREQPQAMVFLFLIGGSVAQLESSRIDLNRPISSALLGILILLGVGSIVTIDSQIVFDRHFLRSLSEEHHKRWGNVETEARLALAAGTFRPHAMIVLGRSLEQQGRYAEAEVLYRQTLEQSPYSWRAHNGLGIIYKRSGKNAEALAEYETALSIYPGARTVRNNLGALYKATGNVRRAETQYRMILEEDAGDAGANNNLGNILKARGEIDSSEVYYRRALDTDPELAPAHNNLAELLSRKKRYGEALDHYRTAADLSPGEALVHWGMGQTLEVMGSPGQAEQAYKQAIEADPAFPRAYFSLGTLQYGLRRWSEAKTLFETFLTLWKGDEQFVKFAEGRIEACESNLERAKRAARQSR
tara:strand:- start:3143 stop:5425 length:2283 start_codon:yes stop_codon:yes gene_type:complete